MHMAIRSLPIRNLEGLEPHHYMDCYDMYDTLIFGFSFSLAVHGRAPTRYIPDCSLYYNGDKAASLRPNHRAAHPPPPSTWTLRHAIPAPPPGRGPSVRLCSGPDCLFVYVGCVQSLLVATVTEQTHLLRRE